jgi:phenylacetic acid degradation operon negative regulatory protein
MRARSALFTLFGDVVRTAGGEAWLGTLTDAMGALRFSPEATRTALHRMTSEGWVEPRRAGRYAAYRLSPRGFDRLEDAAARIYRLRAEPWDGRWRLLLAPDVTGEADRSLRWMGFGRLPDGTWVSPHDHGGGLAALLPGARTFTATADGGREEDLRIAAEAWDLSALREAHAEFLARWDAPAGEPPEQRDAFVDRILLVHHRRSFLFLDPGLPAALLPGDWLGERAAARFRDRYEWSAPAAWSWWRERQAASPAANGAGPDRLDPKESPFARGLDALSTGAPA